MSVSERRGLHRLVDEIASQLARDRQEAAMAVAQMPRRAEENRQQWQMRLARLRADDAMERERHHAERRHGHHD